MYFMTDTSRNGISIAASRRQAISSHSCVKNAEPSTRTSRIAANTMRPLRAPILLTMNGAATMNAASAKICTATTRENSTSGSPLATNVAK
jgi:hypothetical protein